MKITLLTSNKKRHNYFINLLSEICDNLFVIQEDSNIQSKTTLHNYKSSSIVDRYFESVNNAQSRIFGKTTSYNFKKKVNIMNIPYGNLNTTSFKSLSNYLKSDVYIVFGSSYIKGELADFLIYKKTINIHAGVSPYYRGTDCNFWALYDENPHLVGTTIHLLSKGLDNGPVLYHAMSNIKTNPHEYTMSTIKSAFHSVVERIKDGSIFKIKPASHDKNKEIRYSKRNEFNENIVQRYFEKEIDLDCKKFEKSLLKDPFFLEK